MNNYEPDKLSHCPFCGGPAEIAEEHGGFYVRCRGCNASSKIIYPSKVDVYPLLYEAWNKRADKANDRPTLENVNAFRKIILASRIIDGDWMKPEDCL